MPYHKDKQQSFQAAEQAFVQAQEATSDIDATRADYGWHVKKAKKEIEEAFTQVNKALTNASEHQKEQLHKYEQDLEELRSQFEE
ncbi:hypothetical protein BTR23_07690 [Alkalihalophilus pseudofirmus]|uniref:DUF2524 family protein n=1 Tax=Alkalihalobacterium alkalinitrilicum TaxID=427920 RepID=UPI00094CA415|nr:hypothetical protein [Alkalihalobacterium alkalinitrilicum]OLO40361.1 hypothetical protein BTR23_07690 [Alkalihalophilus pseudofirmus]